MIERVDRAGDPRIAPYARVGDGAWLRANGLFVAEGRFVVRRLLEAPRFRVHSVLLAPAALRAMEGELDPAIPVYTADPAVVNAITGFNFHRGCLALAERPAAEGPDALDGARLLALEGVGNPDNVGGLFRVASAFGVGGIVLDSTCGDPFYRKAVRTSMGAVLRVPFSRVQPFAHALRALRERGFTVAALTPRASAQPVRQLARSFEKLVVVAGAEGPGLSDEALDAADLLVRIPMADDVDSLNVTVAAGIALSHLA